MSEELKACPFCKDNSPTIRGGDNRSPYRWAACLKIGCEAEGPVKATKLEAIKSWNKAKR